jgi:N-acetylglucosaminyldiphosphoundecaprenol N-acetyl-beta-D-mannosaminyltransferase
VSNESLPTPAWVLGHAVHPVDLDEAARWTLHRALAPDPDGTAVIVTLNPEIVVRSRADAGLARALASADLTVADGVGVVWAARRSGVALPGRVPGVELVERVLASGGAGLRVYFLGGRPGVSARAASEASARWGVAVAGERDGYFDRAREGADVAREVAASGAHLLLAGLGEGQEAFLVAHRSALGTGVAIGVGGTLDVLAGEAKRTPAWTRRLGLEWAWRVGLDPSRWHRVPRLMRFGLLALRERGGTRDGGDTSG